MSENKNFFRASAEDFKKIPGSPVAYWLTNGLFSAMSGAVMGELVEGRMGLTTGNNDVYLRLWPEVGFSGIGFNFDRKSAQESGLKWFPYNKGGDFRKWYSNQLLLLNWYNDGEEIKYAVTHNPKDPKTTSWSRRIFATDRFFNNSISWL